MRGLTISPGRAFDIAGYPSLSRPQADPLIARTDDRFWHITEVPAAAPDVRLPLKGELWSFRLLIKKTIFHHELDRPFEEVKGPKNADLKLDQLAAIHNAFAEVDVPQTSAIHPLQSILENEGMRPPRRRMD